MFENCLSFKKKHVLKKERTKFLALPLLVFYFQDQNVVDKLDPMENLSAFCEISYFKEMHVLNYFMG